MVEKFNLKEFKILLKELDKGLKKAIKEDPEHPQEADDVVEAIGRLQRELAEVDEIDLSDSKYDHLLPDIQTVSTFIEIVTGENFEEDQEDDFEMADLEELLGESPDEEDVGEDTDRPSRPT